MIKTKEKLYFAYGSNMNLNQMAFRCPDAEVVESVRLEGYRLAFRTNGGGNGVATILPEEGSYVDGVLWRISERDEQHLDHYEGFPFLYRFVIGFNGTLIGLGLAGILSPAASAALHNISTLGVSLRSMSALPKPKRDNDYCI